MLQLIAKVYVYHYNTLRYVHSTYKHLCRSVIIYKSVVILSVHISPSLKELYKHFTVKYGEKWKIIGTMIDLPQSTLVIIEQNYHDITSRCNAMWEKWLQSDTSASWGKLLNAIESAALSNTPHDNDDYGMYV